MLAVGVDAFPMVGIMALCAGFILAMQGASELGVVLARWTSSLIL
jgi:ABC-type transporter Mla maintaining outer membrane lipid asymmetry permease subunit MlaE